MHVNKSTAIRTPQVLLVPYEQKHVPVYHEWMKDADIQEATASEPLTMEQELDMQRSWRLDRDKMTFIVCRPVDLQLPAAAWDGAERMIGDVNLFLSESPDDSSAIVGELELMIAVKTARRRGFGKSSLEAMLQYISKHESDIIGEFCKGATSSGKSMTYLKVKIGKENDGSVRFFQSMGFEKVSQTVDFFGEYELRLPWGACQSQRLRSMGLACPDYSEVPYATES